MSERTNIYQQNKLKFPLWVAKRYLFSKKSHNAINWISGISAAGVAVGTVALVCVLSVFNGFESLIKSMYSSFDPDLKISLVEGKTFQINTPAFEKLHEDKSVAVFTEVIEQNALLRFRDKQMPATIKGVTKNFEQLNRIDSIMYDGDFELFTMEVPRAVIGLGVASTLGVNSHFIDPLMIIAPSRTERINLLNPEKSLKEPLAVNISGIFSVKQTQYDDKYVMISIDLARNLFEYDKNTVSHIELKIAPDVSIKEVQKEIKKILGDKFKVQDRYEQQESFFKIMKIEKWITFLILTFVLLIATFNIIGSLSMLIIDKKEDINTLRNLGAENKLIKRIFLFEGWLISVAGASIGIFLGSFLCLIQQFFGIIKLGSGGNYIVNAYPVVTNIWDVLLVFATVVLMGFFAALYPVKYITTKNDLKSE